MENQSDFMIGKFTELDKYQFTLKASFQDGIIPGEADLSKCYYSNSQEWFFFVEVWQKQPATTSIACNLIRQSQKRTKIQNSQCTTGLTLKNLAPFKLETNTILAQTGETQIVELEAGYIDVRGALISSSEYNRASVSNGDVTAFLASGPLTLKEKILFNYWPSVRDNYLTANERFYNLDKVRKEYGHISENGLNLVKVANSVPSYFEIINLDVFNHASLTSKYSNNALTGKCSTMIVTLKISVETGSTLQNCPNSTCSQHYGTKLDFAFINSEQYNNDSSTTPTLDFPLYFVCSQNADASNLNPANTWCYIALDLPENLNGNRVWRLPNPINAGTSISMQFGTTICQVEDGVFMRFTANLRAFDSNNDQTSVTDTVTKIAKKSLQSGVSWGETNYMLRVRANLSSSESSSSISNGIGIYIWDFHFYSGGMLTALGYQQSGDTQNNENEFQIRNTLRPTGDHRCQFYETISDTNNLISKYKQCLKCPIQYKPTNSPNSEGDNCSSAKNLTGCLHEIDSVCLKCSSNYFSDLARTDSSCLLKTSNCDPQQKNDFSGGECLTCDTTKGCPCNSYQIESATMANGVYPSSSNANRCSCTVTNCKLPINNNKKS